MQTVINEKEIIRTRVARIVTELMESRNWFRETLDQEQMIEHLFNIIEKQVNYEEFIKLSEQRKIILVFSWQIKQQEVY